MMTWCPRCQRAVTCDRSQRRVNAETVTVVLRCRACGTTLSMTDECRARALRLRAQSGPEDRERL
jgi:primosomal protein N'